ncbi:MAG: guanylate kinase [Leptospirales bacterium]
MILILSAPSGTGKNTIIRALKELRSDVVHAISTTTRPVRNKEQDGVDYYYVSRLEFIQMIQNRDFLEWAPVLENYYGTSLNEIERIKKIHKIAVLDIDVQGALQVKKNDPEAILVFLTPPSLQELKERLIGRATENLAQIQERLELASEEIKYKDDYDYHIVNDEVAITVGKIEEIIEKHKQS